MQFPSHIPPPSLNGGHYTGEPFHENAPWATVPVIPDVTFLTHYNLRSANPPQEALYQYPGSERPGNNKVSMIGVAQPPGKGYQHMHFIQDKIPSGKPCNCQKCKMNKYAYI